MSEADIEKLDLAVERFKSGWSLADSAKKYGIPLISLEAEVERRAKAKRNEGFTPGPKIDFVYESAQMEDAVNSVLCGTSIKDAASAYGVSKNALKQALKQELDKEPPEEGGLKVTAEEVEAEETDDLFPVTEVLPNQIDIDLSSGQNPDLSGSDPAAQKRLQDMKFSMLPIEQLQDKIPVHCGSFQGTLHRNKFFCPGLRSECIELSDGRWVTPKVFSIIGGKASLKNWKNAVRINNVSLRQYMDVGWLDFFEHDQNCSGKCSHKSGGSLGKYQSRINSMKIKSALEVSEYPSICDQKQRLLNAIFETDRVCAIDLQTQEELTTSIQKNLKPPAAKQSRQSQQDKQQQKQQQATNKATTVASASNDVQQQPDSSNSPTLLPFVEKLNTSPAFTVLRHAMDGEGTVVSATSTADQPVFPMPTLLGDGKIPVPVDKVQQLSTGATKPLSIIPSSIALSKLMTSQQQRNRPKTIVVQPIVENSTPKGATATYVTQTASGPRLQLRQPNSVLLPVNTSTPRSSSVVAASTLHSAKPTTTAMTMDGFPNIDNIIRDSAPFWKGILDIGLLETTIHEMKVQLSTIKRRILSTSDVTIADGKALSKVASALNMQESIRLTLSGRKNDMKVQNDRLQTEINELKRKMEHHEKQQRELKRKSDMFDELIAKRQCINVDSSDEEEAWTRTTTTPTASTLQVSPSAGTPLNGQNAAAAAAAMKATLSSLMQQATPINIVPVDGCDGSGDSNLVDRPSATATPELNDVTIAKPNTSTTGSAGFKNSATPGSTGSRSSGGSTTKSGRSSRKSNMPVKRTVTPTLLDEASDDDEAINKSDIDDAVDYSTVAKTAHAKDDTAADDDAQAMDVSAGNDVGDTVDELKDSLVIDDAASAHKPEAELTNGTADMDDDAEQDVSDNEGKMVAVMAASKTLKPQQQSNGNAPTQLLKGENGSGDDGKTNGHSMYDSDSENGGGGGADGENGKHLTRVNERSKDKLKMTIRMSAARKTRQSSSRRDSDRGDTGGEDK